MKCQFRVLEGKRDGLDEQVEGGVTVQLPPVGGGVVSSSLSSPSPSVGAVPPLASSSGEGPGRLPWSMLPFSYTPTSYRQFSCSASNRGSDRTGEGDRLVVWHRRHAILNVDLVAERIVLVCRGAKMRIANIEAAAETVVTYPGRPLRHSIGQKQSARSGECSCPRRVLSGC